MAVAPPSRASNLYAMLPALRFGKMSTFAGLFNALKGYRSFRMVSSKAVSACISPSTSRSGRPRRRMPTASATFFACGWSTEPKFENDEHRDARHDPERLHDAARADGDLRQLLGGGIDVDRRVSTEDNVLLEDEHVEAAHDLGLGMRADDLERGTNGLG